MQKTFGKPMGYPSPIISNANEMTGIHKGGKAYEKCENFVENILHFSFHIFDIGLYLLCSACACASRLRTALRAVQYGGHLQKYTQHGVCFLRSLPIHPCPRRVFSQAQRNSDFEKERFGLAKRKAFELIFCRIWKITATNQFRKGCALQ